MGSVWSKIWGSGPSDGCHCGIGWIANCHCCGMLSPECCTPCHFSVTKPHLMQCIWIVVDAFVIILLAIGAVALSDLLVGDEEGINVLDDAGEFAENGLDGILKLWKGTMGEVHSTFYNLFHNTFKASGALSKLVAATLTAGLTISMADLFTGKLGGLKNKCIGKMFDFWNTPITFIKAELYNLSHLLGYVSDIMLFPFEFVTAILAMITLAIWDVLKVIQIGSLICGGSESPCCNKDKSTLFFDELRTTFFSSPRGGGGTGNPKLPSDPPGRRSVNWLGDFSGKMDL